MGRLIADTYVVLWKHFERQKSTDENFLASVVCGLSILLLFANVAQLTALAVRLRVPNGPDWPRLYYLGPAILMMTLSVAGMRLFLGRHPDLQTPDRITARWAGLTKNRRMKIAIGLFVNLLLLLGVRLTTAS